LSEIPVGVDPMNFTARLPHTSAASSNKPAAPTASRTLVGVLVKGLKKTKST
jgi:hypothetical protein